MPVTEETMQKTRKRRVLWCMLYALSLCVVFGVGVGCGSVDVKLEESFEVELDLLDAYRQAGINLKKTFPTGKVPPSMKLQVPFRFNHTYDLRNHPQVKKYRSNITGVRVNQISYEVSTNTLNVSLPSPGKTLDISLGKLGAKDPKTFEKIGFLQPIPGGKEGITDRMLFVDNGRAKLQPFITDFAFEFGVSGALVVDGSKTPNVPKGKLLLTVKLDVTVYLHVSLADLQKAPPEVKEPQKTEPGSKI